MQYAFQMGFEANCHVFRVGRVINSGWRHQERFTNAFHHHLCGVGRGAQDHFRFFIFDFQPGSNEFTRDSPLGSALASKEQRPSPPPNLLIVHALIAEKAFVKWWVITHFPTFPGYWVFQVTFSVHQGFKSRHKPYFWKVAIFCFFVLHSNHFSGQYLFHCFINVWTKVLMI